MSGTDPVGEWKPIPPEGVSSAAERLRMLDLILSITGKDPRQTFDWEENFGISFQETLDVMEEVLNPMIFGLVKHEDIHNPRTWVHLFQMALLVGVSIGKEDFDAPLFDRGSTTEEEDRPES